MKSSKRLQFRRVEASGLRKESRVGKRGMFDDNSPLQRSVEAISDPIRDTHVVNMISRDM